MKTDYEVTKVISSLLIIRWALACETVARRSDLSREAVDGDNLSEPSRSTENDYEGFFGLG